MIRMHRSDGFSGRLRKDGSFWGFWVGGFAARGVY